MPASTQGIRAGRAFVELFADDSKLVRGLRRAEKKLKAFGHRIRALGLKLAGASAAVLAPLGAASKVFAGMGDHLDKMSQRTGISVRELSRLGFAAEQSGSSLDETANAILRMNRRIGRIRAGQASTTQTKAIQALGLAVQRLQRMDPQQTFMALADAMAGMKDKTRAAGLAQRAFGTEVDGVLPLLLQGSKGIEALKNQADQMGLSIGGKDAKAAADLTDRMNILWQQLKRVTFQIGAALAPVLIRTLDLISSYGKSVIDWAKANRHLVVTTAKVAGIVAAAGAALLVLGTAISTVGSVLGGLASIFSLVATAIGGVITVLSAMLTPIGAVVAAAAALGGALVYYSDIGGKAIHWLQGVFGDLVDTAKSAFDGISNALAAGDIKLAAKVLWQALKLEWLKGVTYLEKLWAAFKANFMTVAAKAFYGAVKLAIGAWDGLRAAWVETVSFLKSTWISFTSLMVSAHRRAVGFVTRQLLKLHGVFDKSFDVQGAIRIANQAERSDLSNISQSRQSRLAANDRQTQSQLAKIGRDFNQTAKALDDAATKAAASQHEAAQKRINAAEAALEKARQAYQASLAQAKNEASNQSGKSQNKTPSLKDALSGLKLSNAIGIAVQRSIEVRGTFNAAAIQGLQASNLDQRIADASETTAANTTRLVRDKRRQSQPTFQ